MSNASSRADLRSNAAARAGRSKTMAANVDLLVTVTALANPPPRLVTLDQLLAFAEVEDVAAAVVFTKPDLDDAARRASCASSIGGSSIRRSSSIPKPARTSMRCASLIRGRRALLAGNSGVGKSTIFRALGGESVVGDVSRHGLGRQTTPSGGSTGWATASSSTAPASTNSAWAPSTRRRLTHGVSRDARVRRWRCRFADCTHIQEPDCAVQAGVAGGAIAASRYASYRKILLEPT